MKEDNCHIMIDVETLSKQSNALILSIGAVQFSLNGELNPIYHSAIEVQSCTDVGLHVDTDTIIWWFKQPENLKSILELPCIGLEEALADLSSRIAQDSYIWGHGSVFDIPILENAYKAVGIKPFWNYKNVRDTRTLFDIANYNYEAKGGHNAIDDAINQVYGVWMAYNSLRKGENNGGSN